MPKVLTCIDFDSATQTCHAEAWVDQASWVEWLPTIEQANLVGVAFFVSLVGVAMIANILKPPRDD